MLSKRFFGASASFALLLGCQNHSKNEILIGEIGSMTGSEATFGVSTDNGIRLAVKEANMGGGVLGKKIRVALLDDRGQPTEAAAAATKLIVQDKISILLGEVASSRSLAMAPIAQEHRVPMISPSSTNPKVTETGDYIFRVCFIDPFQGTVMAKFSRETLKVSRVAILRDVRNAYSVGLADFFQESFVQRGGQITGDKSYSAGDSDFKSQLTALRAGNPQALFVPGYYTDVGLIARQARELSIKVPLMGGDGWDSADLFKIGGDSLEGCFYSNHSSMDDPSPVIRAFVEAYEKAYGGRPDSLAALGYDSAKIAFEAVRRAGSTEGSAIRDQLASLKDFPGVTGSISINEARNAVKPAVILKVMGGKAVYEATINP